MKPISVQTWKRKYLAKSTASEKLVRRAISRQVFACQEAWEPLLPGEELGIEVKRYIQAV